MAEPARHSSAPSPDILERPRTKPLTQRQSKGLIGHAAGAAAELCVAQDYERRGFPIARHRWRGQGGEIDLIARDGEGLVFVEVKKSRSFDQALDRLSKKQIGRLQTAAEEYIGTQPRGALTDVRFDVALVNSYGELRIIENAFVDC
ncbi:YraN family protein [Sagittula marina]|uniref:YraN family protein n=1 Tax=Sagittula marina TaxID=943940 RepID=UPI0016223C3B